MKVMSDLHCIELGFAPLRNLYRLTSSIVVPSKTPDNALSYVQTHCHDALNQSTVCRVFPVRHVLIDWPQSTCEIVEETV